jgi:phage/plasmid-like protein (TIGR03299 family)
MTEAAGHDVHWNALAQEERGMTITTPEGFDFRPNLLAATSFDGSTATTFKRTVTATVCDNTRDLALAEPGQAYKVKHSRYSHARLAEARQALAVVHTLADDFALEVKALTSITVTDEQWRDFLDHHVPMTDPKGQPLKGRSKRMAANKRAELEQLYRHDHRAAPWNGTALGVLQATNTWAQHLQTVRRTSRPERNLLNAINGATTSEDRHVLDQLMTLVSAA